MRRRDLLVSIAAAAVIALSAPGAAQAHGRDGARDPSVTVIGHRGASGYVPEHTLAAYFLAILMGADYVEPDLVITKDGVLVARHENEIGGTTNVADRPEFASRRRTKLIDGVPITGWFTEDFTLAEVKTLRAKERIPKIRPDNTPFDGAFEVPTLEEVLAMVEGVNEARRKAADGTRGVKPVGIYPETKHPSYFESIGLALEEPLVKLMRRYGYDDAKAPVFVQSFEVGSLQKLSRMTRVRLVQLLDAAGAPWDFRAKGDPRTYADLARPEGLRFIARYASGVGANKSLIIPRVSGDFLGQPTDLVKNAHAQGLIVHAWTFRAENTFLPADFRSSIDTAAFGDLGAEIARFLETGMDGFFTDHPNIGDAARDAFLNR